MTQGSSSEVFYFKSLLNAAWTFATHVLAGTLVFSVVAVLALLLGNLTTLASKYLASTDANAFLALVIGGTQYALLAVDIAWFLVMLVRASIQLWKAIASDSVWEAKHD